MNTRQVTMKYRMNQWIGIIRECRESGQTVAAWCREHDVNSKSYYYWLRKIRAAACNALPGSNTEGSIVPIEIEKNALTTSAPSTYVSLETISADAVLRFGTIEIEIRNSASAGLIENLMKALQNAR